MFCLLKEEKYIRIMFENIIKIVKSKSFFKRFLMEEKGIIFH